MNKLLLLASATLAMAVFGGATPAVAACDPPTRAIKYLADNQAADGSIDENINESADYVIGAASDAIDPGTLTSAAGKSPFDFVGADLAGARKSLQDANVLGKLIQAVVAGHRDPRRFNGVDLLDTLRHGKTAGSHPRAYYDETTGTFLDAISAGQNQAFAQANAILGLAAAGDPGFKVPARAVTRLKSLQGTSGGWSSFGTFDTNDTSMALMALVASHDTPANDPGVFDKAFAFLRTQQDPQSGGFIFSTQFPGPSDPDSDAFVIEALVATGQDPAAPAWSNSSGNAPKDILTFQDPGSGGFRFVRGGKVQAFATSQAVLGLRGAALPVAGVYAPGAVLAVSVCVGPTVQSVQAAATRTPGLPASGSPPPRARPSTELMLALAAAGLPMLLVSAAAHRGGRRRPAP